MKLGLTPRYGPWIGDDGDIKALMAQLLGESLDVLNEETRTKYDEYFNKPTLGAVEPEKSVSAGDEEETSGETSL